ncbi:MAG: formylglycine-generating enzyme family protein [Planctomycetota bacterium]
MARLISLLAILLFATSTAMGEEAAKKTLPTGIVKEKPAEGRSVKCDAGYMVAYKQVIPGTEIEFTMLPIPGGTYMMGSPDAEEDRQDDEGPQVKVNVQPFWMGKCEVTWHQYQYFMGMYDLFKSMESNKIRPVTDENRIDAVTVPTPLYEPDFTYSVGQEGNMPAVTMTQYAARQYTKWLSRLVGDMHRLPTEAEWEYACRAGTTTRYSWGDDAEKAEEYCWFFDNSDDLLHPVGTKKPNPWGLHDMHGSVAELCMDQYDGEACKKLAVRAKDGLTAVGSITWPKKIFNRVIRGGHWGSEADALRSAARSHTEDWRTEDPNLPKSPWWFTDEEGQQVGFRLVRPLKPVARDKQEKYYASDAELLTLSIDNRLSEGRGVIGYVDKDLPKDIEKVK